MLMLGRGLDARDNQTRQIREAVSNVEKHFGELCQIFAAYVRKTARLRDKADLLVNEIHAYAATETPNLKFGLKNFADEFSKLQDYRQAEVERLEAKVVEPLKCYGTIIKLKREDLKATLTAKNREAKQLSQLERTRQRNPSDRHIIFRGLQPFRARGPEGRSSFKIGVHMCTRNQAHWRGISSSICACGMRCVHAQMATLPPQWIAAHSCMCEWAMQITRASSACTNRLQTPTPC
ncbi:protein FAM92A isoform X4 [Crotalus tigris]|uniref:protein FAM92A isoform X4 n=1 Tax=Crotalus tigris TaxID=88082 RepID=UPI00192F4252|nr:protein FAM92A isoform X4 [Crotalus tigris]